MKLFKRILLILTFLTVSFLTVRAQELDWEKMLTEDVENINPVYKPVIGIGTGYINFLGDVRNNVASPLTGSMAFRANMHAFLDLQKHYKFNFYLMLTIPGDKGTPMTVNQRSFLDPGKNFRFQSDLLIFGINGHYDFDHFIKKSSFMRPFVSVGAEFFTFSSKADLIGHISGTKIPSAYNYWTDGTIRNLPQSLERQSQFVVTDNIYETDLRSDTFLNKSGVKYNQYSFAIPLDVGVEMAITNRTSIRIGYSFHLTFTDYIDNITASNPIYGNKDKGGYDNFSYSYVSLHFDLFSDPKMLRMNRLFLELENFDYDLLGDEDGDLVTDINDVCLHTPKGIEVDTLGCPFDTDKDDVPDYADKDQNSIPGSIVDRDGVEIQDALVWANLGQEALPRDQVETYLSIMNNLGSGSGRRLGSIEIPEKFKSVDVDGDGYISFDEVLKAIDAFFDFDNELTTDDIYELNDFFFSQ